MSEQAPGRIYATMDITYREKDPRSTPHEIEDLTHVYDRFDNLWCYSEPGDVWLLRDGGMKRGDTIATSARSFQRLVADFAPLTVVQPEP